MKKSKFLQGSKDLLHRSFKPDKCKTSLRLVMSRLKLLRNKKEVQVKQIRREVSQLLESGQDQTARIRVEHVVREEKMMSAYELIALYSELIMTRMTIIESQKNCPIDLKEAITSIIFASPRCGDVPELDDVRKQFTAKYGKDFINAAIELRPDCGVSRMLVEKLSAKAPDGQAKLKILTAIAEEYSIQWDPKSFGDNEATAPNDLLNGPTTFEDSKVHYEAPRYEAHSTGTPQTQKQEQALKPDQNPRFSQGTQSYNYTQTVGAGGTTFLSTSQHEQSYSGVHIEDPVGNQSFSTEGSSSMGRKTWNMEFKDAGSAAQAAAVSAEQASMAARAAAEFANHERVMKQKFVESQDSGIHVQRDNTAGKHLSSKSESEQFRKDSTSSSSSDTYPRSRNEQVKHAGYDNLGRDDRRSDQGGHDSTKRHSRKNSSRSNTSVDDDSLAHGIQYADTHPRSCNEQVERAGYDNLGRDYRRSDQGGYDSTKRHSHKNSSISNAPEDDDSLAHGTQYADNYSPKSSSKEEKKISGKSEYVSHLQEGSRHENFDYIQEENTIKQSVTSSHFHSHSNFYGDDDDSSDCNRQNLESHAVSSEHERIHIGISRSGSADAASAVSDDTRSDDDKVLYDTGPKFDEPDYDFDILSSGRTSPFNVFSNPDTHDSGFNNISPKKSSSQKDFSEKHSSHEFPDVLIAPKDDLKFDDSDGIDSEIEDSTDESRHCSAEVHGEGHQIHSSSRNPGLDQKRLFKSSTDEFEFTEVQRTNNQGTELYSSSSKNLGSLKTPARGPPQKIGKSKLELNDEDLSESKLSFLHEAEDSDRSPTSFKGLVDDETLSPTSSELGSILNFGNLTGGLRHKGYTLPSYTKNPSSDVSYSSKESAEESSSKNLESPDIEFPSSRNTNVNVDNISNLRAKDAVCDSVSDCSDDELPEPAATQRKSYTPKAPKFKYFESESEEDSPKQTFGGQKNLGGVSRRTKPTPSTSGTSKVRPTHEEPKNSASGAERKSMSSSYYTQSVEEPESEKRSSGHSRKSERPSSRKGSYERIPDSKTSFHQESVKSAAVEQPASPQKKVDDAIVDSTKSSQASTLKADTLDRVDSSKTPSHVHPKLPNYEDIFETLRKNRQ